VINRALYEALKKTINGMSVQSFRYHGIKKGGEMWYQNEDLMRLG